MKKKILLLIFILFMIGMTILSCYYTYELIDNNQKELINSEFNSIENNIINTVESNITALKNEVVLAEVSLTNMLNATLDLNYSNRKNMEDVLNIIKKNSIVNIDRILCFHMVNSTIEKNLLLKQMNKMYNKINIQPYSLINGTAVFNLDTRLPLLLLTIMDDINSSPGLPDTGTPNYPDNRIPSIDEIFKLPDRTIVSSSAFSFELVNGEIITSIQLRVINRPWMCNIFLSPTDYLKKILDNIDQNLIHISVSDSSGIFYETKAIKQSDYYNTRQIDLISEIWTFKITASEEFIKKLTNDSKIIIVICIIIIGIISLCLVLSLYYAWHINIKNLLIEKEIDSAKKVENMNNSSNIIIHEINNILCASISLLSLGFEKLTRNHKKIISSSINRCRILCKSILDFHKILSENSQPNLENENIIDVITDSVFHGRNKIILKYCDTILKNNIVKIDKFRIEEILHNVIINAVTHTDKDIIITVCNNNGHLIITMNNYCESIPKITENTFIPFFMKNNEIWKDKIEFLRQDSGMIKLLCDGKRLKYEQIIKEYNDEMPMYEKKSIGLGLPICKLLAKSMNGDCGAFYNNSDNIFTFWLILPIIKLNELSI